MLDKRLCGSSPSPVNFKRAILQPISPLEPTEAKAVLV